MNDQEHKNNGFQLILRPIAATIPAGADCSACSASCQSACKTSCTVGNQPCTAVGKQHA